MGLFLKYLKQRKRYIAAGAAFCAFVLFLPFAARCGALPCGTLRFAGGNFYNY